MWCYRYIKIQVGWRSSFELKVRLCGDNGSCRAIGVTVPRTTFALPHERIGGTSTYILVIQDKGGYPLIYIHETRTTFVHLVPLLPPEYAHAATVVKLSHLR